MTARKKAAEGLRKAADFFRTNKWGTGDTYDATKDTYCLLGGLSVGLFGLHGHGYNLHAREAGRAALTAVNEVIGERIESRSWMRASRLDGRELMENAYRWNDGIAKDEKEVIEVLEEAAIRIEKRLAEEGEML